MSQHDMVIDNGPGLAVRTDINAAMQALASSNAGPVEPTVKYAGQLWLDTSVAPGGVLRMRDQGNAAWTNVPVSGIGRSTYLAKSGAYTALAGDSGATIVFSAAATLSLDNAATLATGWFVRVIAPLTGGVVIDPAAAETIDGAATVTVKAGQSCMVFCSGTLFVTDKAQTRGWEMVEMATLSGAATYVKTGLAAARRVKLSGWLKPSVDATLGIRTSSNGGSTWDQGATDYVQNGLRQNGAGVTGFGGNFTFMGLNAAVVVLAANGITFEITLEEFNKAQISLVRGHSGWYDPTSNLNQMSYYGIRNSGAVRDAVQILATSGTLTGEVTLEIMRG